MDKEQVPQENENSLEPLIGSVSPLEPEVTPEATEFKKELMEHKIELKPGKKAIPWVLILAIVAGLSLILNIYLLAKPGTKVEEPVPSVTPTITPSFSITPSLIPTVTVTMSLTPTAMASVTPAPTITLTQVVNMDEFNARLYLPANWAYSRNPDQNDDYYYTFFNENGNEMFSMGFVDGGVLDNFCRDGNVITENLTIEGKTETINSCYVSGNFMGIYSSIDSFRLALIAENPLDGTSRNILQRMVYTGNNPGIIY